MTSFEFDIGEKSRVGSRFLSLVKSEIQKAFFAEKRATKITQKAIADKLGVNKSVTNRQIMGLENMTIRSVAELLWALGWKPHFEARKPGPDSMNNEYIVIRPTDERRIIGEMDSADTRTDRADFQPRRTE